MQSWTVSIEDVTGRVRRIAGHVKARDVDRAEDLLPREHVFPVAASLATRLALS